MHLASYQWLTVTTGLSLERSPWPQAASILREKLCPQASPWTCPQVDSRSPCEDVLGRVTHSPTGSMSTTSFLSAVWKGGS
jgi:hypothetical protein